MIYYPFTAFLILAVGLCFGSFITLAAHRLPRGEDIVLRPSRCTKCDRALRPAELIPVLSWLLQRGRCAQCGTPVGVRYPAMELVTGIGFLWIYNRYGLSAHAVLYAAFFVVLHLLVAIDFEHFIIPDSLQWALAILAVPHYFLSSLNLQELLAGAALGGGIAAALHYGYRWWKGHDGLGFGDVKLMAVAGLWLGATPLVPFLFFSGLTGIATALVWRALGRGRFFPFGPALAMSLFFCVTFPELPRYFWWVLTPG